MMTGVLDGAVNVMTGSQAWLHISESRGENGNAWS